MNDAEKVVSEKLKESGWKIFTRGWPDFLCLKRHPYHLERVQVMCVEVKAGRDWLSEDQVIIHTFLKKAGIPCYVVKTEEAIQFNVESVQKKTVRFTGQADIVNEELEPRDELDERGVPYKNRVQELTRKLRKAEEKISQYEQLILKGKAQDDDCVLTS